MSETRSVLVTGGAGYVGSHSCKALAQAGYKPIAYDNLVCGHADFVKWGPFEKGDITDSGRLDEVMRKHRPEAVLHFAAYAYVGESIENPAKYYVNNVAGTLKLLEAMRSYGIDKIVFSSSCATYGVPNTVPISEEEAKNPISPYGLSKHIVEQILKDYDRAHGVRSISLRYFNAAGADPECEIGEDHRPETHLIPLILNVALGIDSYITIFGDDYPTPDRTCIRDYVHVSDLADAHVLALKVLEQGRKTDGFNLGSGQGYSVREIVDIARQVTEKPISIVIGARRPGDPDRLVSDPTKAIMELGWRPKYTELHSILMHAWEWHRKRFVRGEKAVSND